MKRNEDVARGVQIQDLWVGQALLEQVNPRMAATLRPDLVDQRMDLAIVSGIVDLHHQKNMFIVAERVAKRLDGRKGILALGIDGGVNNTYECHALLRNSEAPPVRLCVQGQGNGMCGE